MRWAAARDANEAPIVQALELKGWSVFKLSSPGMPDLLCIRRGRMVLLEVKTPKGELKPAQVKTFQRMKAAGYGVAIVRTPSEAVEAVAEATQHQPKE
jgi:hypothetical protein